MVTANTNPVSSIQAQILKAVAEFYFEQGLSWPSKREIAERIGPTSGLSTTIDVMVSEGKLLAAYKFGQTFISFPDPGRHWMQDYRNVLTLGNHLVSDLAFDGDQLQAYYAGLSDWNVEWACLCAIYPEIADAETQSGDDLLSVCEAVIKESEYLPNVLGELRIKALNAIAKVGP